jgi:hypothetical protein
VSDEVGLVIVGPRLPFPALAVHERLLEGVFEVIVGNVVPVIVLDQRLAKLLTEPVKFSAKIQMVYQTKALTSY